MLTEAPSHLLELAQSLFGEAVFSTTGTDGDVPPPLVLQRREDRYLLKSGKHHIPALSAWASLDNQYHVQTIYVDTPEGTWTRGRSQLKFRLRNYNTESVWWIELKTNIDGRVNKHRRQIALADLDNLGLVPVSHVRYARREFEHPDTSDGFRVTLDSDLVCERLPADLPLSEVASFTSEPIAHMERMILETKFYGKRPTWLDLPERWGGSKSRWSLAVTAA